MARNQGKINIGVGFNVDTASLNNIKKTLHELSKLSGEQIKAAGGNLEGNFSKDAMHSWKNNLGDMRKELNNLEKAFTAAFNPKLNTYEIDKFNASLKESDSSISRAFEALNRFGVQGQAALLDVTTNMLAVDRAAKQVDNTFKKLGDTMLNTIRWTITSTAVNTVTGAIQEAYHYALDLDKSLNDIRIVTGKSADDMNKFAREANKAAKALGAQTKDYTDASLIYYQQGLSDTEVKARTDVTVKAAAVTGQTADEVSSQLTAVWNGYKVTAQEAEKYVDKLAAVAASSAADLEELSTGMSQVASAANIMGVDVDQLNAQLATIVSVTREAPETIGTALKTVYARMSDIEAGLDTETTLGEYTSQMAQMGINVLDANGKLRDMGDVVNEIGSKWSSLNREQQVSLAQSIAGTRQYSRMMALFDNWNMYQEQLNVSMNATNTLNQQWITQLDSTEAHMNKLKASAEGLYDSIFDSEDINGVVDGLATIVEYIDHLVQAMGGMPGILATAGMLVAKIGKQSIANLITVQQENHLNAERNKMQLSAGRQMIEQFKAQADQKTTDIEYLNKIIELEDEIYKNANNLTGEQWNKLQSGVQGYNTAIQEYLRLEEQRQGLEKKITEYEKNQKSNKATAFTDATGVKTEYKLGTAQGRAAAKKKAAKLAKSGDVVTATAMLEAADAAERAKQEYDEAKKSLENYTEETKNAKNNVDALGEAVKDSTNAFDKANRITTIIDSLSTIAFTATTASSSLVNTWNVFKDGTDSASELIGSLSGVVASFAPLVTGSIKAAQGIKKVKDANITGAAAWTAYWSAATMGISLAITVLTTVVEAIANANAKKLELIDTTYKEADEARKAAQENQNLADSYLELYNGYVEVGKATDEFISSAEATIEKLKNEEFEVLLLRQEYDALAIAIRNYKDEERGKEKKAAETMKAQAENALGMTKISNTAGLGGWNIFANKNQGFFGVGWHESAAESKNLALIQKYLGTKYTSMDGDQLVVDFPREPQGIVEVYNLLLSATEDEGWDKSSDNEVHKNVQKMLSDAELSDAMEKWNTASEQLGSLNASDIVKNAGINESSDITDIAAFRKTRQESIEELKKQSPELDPEEAARYIDAEIASKGGNAAKLLERANFVTAWTAEGQAFEGQERALVKALNTLDDNSFAMLRSMGEDIRASGGNINAIIELAKVKATETRELAWANASSNRLASLSAQLEESEKVADKSLGINRTKELEKQVELLKDQEEILRDQAAAYQKAADTAKEEFEAKAAEFGVAQELQALITAGDYEGIQDKLGELEDLDPTEANALQTALIALMNAENKVTEATQAANDTLEDQRETSKELAHALVEAHETAREIAGSMMQVVESQIELTQLLEGETADVADYHNTLVDLSLNDLELAMGAYKAAQAELIKLQEEHAEDQAAITAAQQQVYEKQTAALNATNAYYEQIKAQYAAIFQQEFNIIRKSIFGNTDLELLQDTLDWASELDDRRYDTINSKYQKESLLREIDLAKASAASVNAQRLILQFREQITEQMENATELSARQVEYARQEFELLQARIALEEAQANKSKMQLTRSADGTYSYEYVVDTEAIQKAEEEKIATENEVYNSRKGSVRDEAEWVINQLSQWEELVTKYAQSDNKLTDEEEDQLRSMYSEILKSANGAEDSIVAMITQFAKDYTGDDIDLALKELGFTPDFFNQLTTTDPKNIDSAITSISEIAKNQTDALNNIASLLGKSEGESVFTNTKNIITSLSAIVRSLGLGDFDTAKKEGSNNDYYLKSTGNLNQFSSADTVYASSIEGEANHYFRVTGRDKNGRDEVELRDPEEDSSAVWDNNEITVGSESFINANGTKYVKAFWGGAEYYLPEYMLHTSKNSTTEDAPKGVDSPVDEDDDGITEPEYPIFGQLRKAKARIAQFTYEGITSHFITSTGKYYNGDGVLTDFPDEDPPKLWIHGHSSDSPRAPIPLYEDAAGTYYINVHSEGKPGQNWFTPINDVLTYSKYWEDGKGWVRKYPFTASYDTGGYTGDWGTSDGRIAMVHEKELILNKGETKDFLNAIEILRSLNLSMLSNVRAMGQVSAPMARLEPASGQTIEQHIEINADFSGVESAAEIKQAFEEIAQLAVQHAYENK